ncbi:hypothetical protein [Nitrospira sp. KM1]|uniref:tetratricopeptide repeat protein n=1 Tax=Nitrospira sp. KM1 TaxID=1936990 RepID=UPI0015643573|nr:hypothetical protein [Nitrospira sp. KM1]
MEEAGVYLETIFHDIARESHSHITQMSALEIRTISAAIVQTQILETRRSFDTDCPVFFIRIRATVNVQGLTDIVRRLHAEARLAEHFHQLQRENSQLRERLKDLQREPVGVRILAINPDGQSEGVQRARILLTKAIHTHDLADKIRLASEALTSDNGCTDASIIRGQTYLRLVSIAFSQQSASDGYADHLERARADFDRAVQLDGKNVWGWLGKGDTQTWLRHSDEAAASYEQALALDPFFDLARQRLIVLYTMKARQEADAKHWNYAVRILNALIEAQPSESWVPYQKEAYLLRSDLFLKLKKPDKALGDLNTVINVDPMNAGALFIRGTVHMIRLNRHLAKEDFEKACDLGDTRACEQLR